MGLFGKKKDKKKNKSIHTFYISGIESYNKDNPTTLILDNWKESLIIESKESNYPTYVIDFNQIIVADVLTENEVLQENKSVVGRAAIGGVLLGPLGAIIGGMSGIGNKTYNQAHYYLVINYKSKTGEIKILSFETAGFSNWRAFIKELKGKILINKQSSKEKINL